MLSFWGGALCVCVDETSGPQHTNTIGKITATTSARGFIIIGYPTPKKRVENPLFRTVMRGDIGLYENLEKNRKVQEKRP